MVAFRCMHLDSAYNDYEYRCSDCVAGSYNELLNQSSCKLCPSHTYSTVVGSNSSLNCLGY